MVVVGVAGGTSGLRKAIFDGERVDLAHFLFQ